MVLSGHPFSTVNKMVVKCAFFVKGMQKLC